MDIGTSTQELTVQGLAELLDRDFRLRQRAPQRASGNLALTLHEHCDVDAAIWARADNGAVRTPGRALLESKPREGREGLFAGDERDLLRAQTPAGT